MSVICKVDGKEFPSEKSLHMSLKDINLIKRNIIKHILKDEIY